MTLEVIDISTGAGFVRHGLGVAIMPRFAVPDDVDLVVRPVADADLDWPLGVATSAIRAPGAAARALLGMIDDHLRPPGDLRDAG